MLVTTLNIKLLKEYGLSTVAKWHKFTKHRIVLVVHPDELNDFKDVFGQSYTVIPFGEKSIRCIQEIREKEDKLCYRKDDYRWQASRFSWKIFAVEEVYCNFGDEDQIIWLDADSLIKPGFDDWLLKLISNVHAISFLGRTHKQMHAETGLISFRGSQGREIFCKVLQIYKSFDIFNFNEWTDSYIYSHIFQFYSECFDVCKSKKVKSSNPLHEIDRGRHIVHLKGQRKVNSNPLLDNIRILLRK